MNAEGKSPTLTRYRAEADSIWLDGQLIRTVRYARLVISLAFLMAR